MNYCLHSSKGLSGLLRVPGDRSITVRAAVIAAIAEGATQIREPLDSEDTNAALRCILDLGVATASFTETGGSRVVQISGVGLRGLRRTNTPMDCDSSGTTIRLVAGLL
jgi:3-phosphoshikimate 1-carboxyvinyltransferase